VDPNARDLEKMMVEVVKTSGKPIPTLARVQQNFEPNVKSR
jgi:hypothetical protein